MDGERSPDPQGVKSAPLAELLVQAALDEGFALAGVVDVAKTDLSAHVARYDAWLGRGYAGAMEYLARGRDRRADVAQVFPGCRSVLCAAIPYRRTPAGAASEAQGPRYARYLDGPDYHEDLAARLERAMARVNAALEERGEKALGFKVCVDTSAVLERSWAAVAGLGWIGKNTMLIHPKLGSYLFLAEVLLDRETGRGPAPLPDYCGSCRRCIDACPVGALVEPRLLDSNRCISYLTLEKRGELDLAPEVRAGTGPWIAGCDLCQEACPFNLKAVRAEQAAPPPPHPESATRVAEWRRLLLETEEGYRARVQRSALKRVKPAQFRRNLALAIASSAAALEPETRAELLPLVLARLEQEREPAAKREWERCIERLRSGSDRKPAQS